VDLGIVTVPRQNVMAATQSSIEAGVKALAVITAGYRETGEEGARLEQELAGLCRAHNVRLLGPNCLGIMNRHHHMNASFAGDMPEAGGISVFSQSGALCTAIVDSSVTGHFGLAKLVSLGNKADLTEVDFLRALARDDDTKVIVGYLEDIASGDEFVKAAEDACSVKPVVILKAGTTPAGLKAASSHTGGLAGADMAYGAAFRRSGVIRADNFQALFDYASALAMQPCQFLFKPCTFFACFPIPGGNHCKGLHPCLYRGLCGSHDILPGNGHNAQVHGSFIVFEGFVAFEPENLVC